MAGGIGEGLAVEWSDSDTRVRRGDDRKRAEGCTVDSSAESSTSIGYQGELRSRLSRHSDRLQRLAALNPRFREGERLMVRRALSTFVPAQAGTPSQKFRTFNSGASARIHGALHG
jgi:hypothetical protein